MNGTDKKNIKGHFSADINYDDSLSIKLDYDQQKIIEFLAGYLLFTTSLPKNLSSLLLEQSSRSIERSDSYERRRSGFTIKSGSEDNNESLSSWFRAIRVSGRFNQDAIKQIENYARQAEAWIRRKLPIVVEGVLLPVLSSTVLEAAGVNETIIKDIVKGLPANFDQEMTSQEEKTSNELEPVDSSEAVNKNPPAWSFTFNDDFGGAMDCSYQYSPVATEMMERISQFVSNRFSEVIEQEIKQRNLTKEEAEDLKRRRYEQRDAAILLFTKDALEAYKQDLPQKLRESLSDHMAETVARRSPVWEHWTIKDEKGEGVKFRTDTKRLNRIITDHNIKRTRTRINAPGKGRKRKGIKQQEILHAMSKINNWRNIGYASVAKKLGLSEGALKERVLRSGIDWKEIKNLDKERRMKK